MDSKHLARLEEVTRALYWAVEEAENARYGVAEERVENRIWEAFDRANEVRREVQVSQGQARQQREQNSPSSRPTKPRHKRKLL